MSYVILYLIIGLLLTFLFRVEDDAPAFLDFPLNLVIILGWPLVILYMAGRVKTFKWKGKVVWSRK